jgi:hypothetical protein
VGSPKLGGRFTEGGEEFIWITTPSDPIIGNADVAAFVPVAKRANQERYFPADKDGNERKIEEVGWTQLFDGNSSDRRPLSVPVERCRGKFAGVLAILLYNQSADLGRGGNNYPVQFAQFLKMDLAAHGPLAGFDATASVEQLAEFLKKATRIPVRSPVLVAIEVLLKDPVGELKPGLIELA